MTAKVLSYHTSGGVGFKAPLAQAISLKNCLELAMEATGCKDPILERQVHRILAFEECMEGYHRSRKPYLFVNALLLQSFTSLTLNQVKSTHAMALKAGVLSRGWGVARVVGLYGDGFANSLGYSREKTEEVYNSLMFVYSKNCPEKAEDLFKEMVKKGMVPTGVTFRALISAFSQGGRPDKAREYLNLMMKEYRRLTPNDVHYGALVDAYARTRTPKNLLEAIQIVKEVPIAATEISVNAILSRCVPLYPSPSKEDLKEIEEVKTIAQDFVDYLDEKNCKYAVLETTYWRLERVGLKWPESVSKKGEEGKNEGRKE